MPANNPRQQNLPEKTCPVCGRPFRWRKKWARDWENVVYCSKKCAAQGRRTTHHAPKPTP